MTKLIYDISIYVLNALLTLASLFDPRAGNLINGRKGWYVKLKEATGKIGTHMIWFHCASLGEFEQGRPVIERIKQLHPDRKIMITFFSPSGYEIRKNYEPADTVLYLPSDTPGNARKFIESAKPAMAVFIKYEFWYNFISSCKENHIPLISISSVFRTGQIFFKPWGNLFRNMLNNFEIFFVQDDRSRELLEQIGIKKAMVSGDTRFDRVHDICSHPKDIDLAARFSNGSPVMVLGSTWPSDMKIFFGMLNDTSLNLKFIIASHNISEPHLREIESPLQVPFARFSSGYISENTRILIIDNVGMLYSLYRYGKIAYVGGAFKGGLHNILEPAAYGIPVLFGNHPSNARFRETAGLTAAGGGFPVSDTSELRKIIGKLISEREFYENAARASAEYIISNTGATDKIVHYISSHLNGQ